MNMTVLLHGIDLWPVIGRKNAFSVDNMDCWSVQPTSILFLMDYSLVDIIHHLSLTPSYTDGQAIPHPHYQPGGFRNQSEYPKALTLRIKYWSDSRMIRVPEKQRGWRQTMTNVGKQHTREVNRGRSLVTWRATSPLQRGQLAHRY